MQKQYAFQGHFKSHVGEDTSTYIFAVEGDEIHFFDPELFNAIRFKLSDFKDMMADIEMAEMAKKSPPVEVRQSWDGKTPTYRG